VTTPTTGEVKVKGRIASLLEVGTGFHPDLSGRENIYLNGAILGMRNHEITRKLDEIIDFSGCDRYIDTPVKRYSSGMYVRLAFAVAAHLDPEILIVDEVLAVGDAEFQKKCLGKMKDVARGGRTVLFVSHNMAAISSLTESVVVIERGQIRYVGPTTNGLQQYLQCSNTRSGVYTSDRMPSKVNPFVSMITTGLNRETLTHFSGDSMEVSFTIDHLKPISGACFSFQIVNQFQQPVVHCWIYDVDSPICRDVGPTVLRCTIPKLSLNFGQYSLNTYLSEPPSGNIFETLEGVCSFKVEIVGKQTLFGWRTEACAYLEEFQWSVN